MAFQHLRDKGLRRFAFSSLDLWPMSERREAFKRIVAEAGFEPVDTFSIDPRHQSMNPGQRDALRQWVAGLQKPVGLFCASIAEAWRVVEACHQLGVHVPDEVAVVGCDKDDLTCVFTHPPLSTIDHGMEHAGYEAAALLHRLMDGEPAPKEPLLIAPVGVIERQSSDTLAIEDANVRDAMRYIREAALRGIAPGDVVEQVLVGRRRLEMRFKEVVGRTIQQQIVHERVEHARHLLINTELSLADIGRRCCFDHVSRLSEAFTRVVGTPPSVYRRESRKNAG
jgi:LacI family transcriptional regulator